MQPARGRASRLRRVRRRRSPARFLGPIALLVVIAAIVFVVQGSTKDSGSSSSTTTTTRTTQSGKVVTSKSSTTTTVKETGPATYTIAAGDTYETISEKTHIPVGRLQAYNPDIDASALVVGQTLKLRRSASP